MYDMPGRLYVFGSEIRSADVGLAGATPENDVLVVLYLLVAAKRARRSDASKAALYASEAARGRQSQGRAVAGDEQVLGPGPRSRHQQVQHHEHVVLGRGAGQPDLGQPVLQPEHVQPPGACPTSPCARSSTPNKLPQGQHRDPDRPTAYPFMVPRGMRSRSSTSGCRTSRSAAPTSWSAFFKQWWFHVLHGLAGGRQQAADRGPGPRPAAAPITREAPPRLRRRPSPATVAGRSRPRCR